MTRAHPFSLLCAWIAGFLALASPSPLRAQAPDPSLAWRTIETPHFRVHYHAPLALLARRTAAVAERAHDRLAELFGAAPRGRVELVLSDESDAANGSATALPFDTIRLYAEAPDDLSPLADYDDWATLLVTHEQAHIHHLDQAYGLAAFINALLGRSYMPNHVSPRWLLEGVAVWQESDLSSAGRLRSTQWDMYLRADVLEDRFLTIAQMSNDVERWPHGNAAYLYGSEFVSFVARHHGSEAIAAIVRDYAGSVLPYGINRVFERATGASVEALWERFEAETRERVSAFERRVEAEGRVEGRALTRHGELARSPRFLADGALVYARSDGQSRPRLVVVDERGEPARELVRLRGDGDGLVLADGRTLIYTRVEPERDLYEYPELFERDLETGDERQLTRGLRARDPDVSRDGRWITFITSSAGSSHLWIAERAELEATRRRLAAGPRYAQFYTPRFSPDGRTIACSRWMPGGYRDVVLVDVRTGRVRPVTRDRALDTGPSWSNDGRTLYFSSDRTGAANIYAYHLPTGSLRQITNVLTGAYQPAVSNDGSRLVYVGYTSRGFDLFELDLERVASRPAPSYADVRPDPVETEALYHAESHAYDPLPTLYPRSYLVDLGADSWGPELGISFAGEDVLRFHRWSARLGVGLTRGSWRVDADYGYGRSPLDVSARIFRREALRRGLEVRGEARDWIEEAVGVSVGLQYRFPAAFRSTSIGLSYDATHTRPSAPLARAEELDPNAPPPRLPETGLFSTLRFAFVYSDVERRTYDISPSDGRTIVVAASLSDPLIGSHFRLVTLDWSITQFVPLAERHVLALRYAGGTSGGDVERRSLYAVGGFPDASPFDSLLAPVVLGGAALRGYPVNARVGTQYHLAQLEYRFPLLRLDVGYATLPFYLNRIHGTLFCDVGDAFRGDLDPAALRVGAGAELLLEFTVFYLLGFTLRVGYAHGFMEGGLDQVYGHLGVPF